MTQSSLLMLSWATCGDDGHWCDFLRLKLDSDSLSKGGVYHLVRGRRRVAQGRRVCRAGEASRRLPGAP